MQKKIILIVIGLVVLALALSLFVSGKKDEPLDSINTQNTREELVPVTFDLKNETYTFKSPQDWDVKVRNLREGPFPGHEDEFWRPMKGHVTLRGAGGQMEVLIIESELSIEEWRTRFGFEGESSSLANGGVLMWNRCPSYNEKFKYYFCGGRAW